MTRSYFAGPSGRGGRRENLIRPGQKKKKQHQRRTASMALLATTGCWRSKPNQTQRKTFLKSAAPFPLIKNGGALSPAKKAPGLEGKTNLRKAGHRPGIAIMPKYESSCGRDCKGKRNTAPLLDLSAGLRGANTHKRAKSVFQKIRRVAHRGSKEAKRTTRTREEEKKEPIKIAAGNEKKS